MILLDPAGEVFRQSTAQSLASAAHLVLLCPRYEGVDERIRSMVDRELSIGDYVLTGGELAALVVVDAVLRLLPGAIDEASTAEESFAAGLLEYPQYTRPATFDGVSVPPVLVSGHHEEVRRWRLRESLRRTLLRRPDLLHDRPLSPEERRLLDDIRTDRRRRDATASAHADAVRRGLTPALGRAILRRRPRRPRHAVHHLRALRSRGCRPNVQGPVPVNVLNEIVQDQLRTDLPVITPGDTVKVAAKVIEGNRERVQVFEGLVMRMRNSGIASTITVRRIASGVGVERTFKLHSPRIDRIEVVRHGQVRRAKLYFLRDRVGKAATTLRERR